MEVPTYLASWDHASNTILGYNEDTIPRNNGTVSVWVSRSLLSSNLIVALFGVSSKYVL